MKRASDESERHHTYNPPAARRIARELVAECGLTPERLRELLPIREKPLAASQITDLISKRD